MQVTDALSVLPVQVPDTLSVLPVRVHDALSVLPVKVHDALSALPVQVPDALSVLPVRPPGADFTLHALRAGDYSCFHDHNCGVLVYSIIQCRCTQLHSSARRRISSIVRRHRATLLMGADNYTGGALLLFDSSTSLGTLVLLVTRY